MLPYKITTYPFIRAARRPYKKAQGFLSALVFGFPSRKIRVVGITGTTGKTTTIHLTAVGLQSAGYKVGVASSIRIQIGTMIEKNKSGLTSLGPWTVQKLLARMVKAGCHYAVLEVSSHALDQCRFWGVDFDVAVITNLYRDHLDYHHTLDDYAAAKKRLFKSVAQRLPKYIDGKYVPRVIIASLDDPQTSDFLSENADYRYGVTLLDSNKPTPPRTEQVYLYSPRIMPDKTTAVVMAKGRNSLLRLKLGGSFNVRNALSALAVGVSQDIVVERVARELSEIEVIPGRFERINEGQPFQVIVDYAVTEAALKTLFGTIKAMRPRRILAVFGACGNRDRGKRPGMAKIVGDHADIVFLTNEDPFTEDPEQIFSDLKKGFSRCKLKEVYPDTKEKDKNKIFVKIPDRREAIRAAVAEAKPGDVIVATGKGAEEVMRFKDKTVSWNEGEVFREELRKKYGTAN